MLVAFLVLTVRAQDVEKDRDVISTLKAGAEHARMRGEPSKNVFMMCDAANQSNFTTPRSGTNAHGIDDKWVPSRRIAV